MDIFHGSFLLLGKWLLISLVFAVLLLAIIRLLVQGPDQLYVLHLPPVGPTLSFRPLETTLLVLVIAAASIGFMLTTVALNLKDGVATAPSLPETILPFAAVAAGLLGIHLLMSWRDPGQARPIWPITGMLVTVGLILIWRLRGSAGVWQQLSRGWLPGLAVIAILLLYPRLVEHIRRRWAVVIGVGGVLLLLVTAFIGVSDGSGARLSLKLGPLPAVQTVEITKLALIIFLAWYIERVGEAATGRGRAFGWLRLPALSYFIPGILFVFLATLALVKMADFGALPILAGLFVTMLYVGFEPRIFATIALIGLALSLLVTLLLVLFWDVPPVISQRLLAYRDPWSQTELVIDGQPTGVTVAEGPGYQIQQSIYAVVAGGFSGTGLGLGTPDNVPLAHSDFIFAAVAEELGAAVAVAVLALFAILILGILRLAALLPHGQVFERLLLVGIGTHFFWQVFIMVAGTLNTLPTTGITIPFLSQGSIALLVNLSEVGLVLALSQRLSKGQ